MEHKTFTIFKKVLILPILRSHLSLINKVSILLLFSLFGFSFCAQAQFLKKMAKKIENKLEPNSNTQSEVATKPYVYSSQSTAVMVPGNAGQYMWFTKGAQLNYKTIIAEPSQTSQIQMTVKNLYNENDMAVSEMEIKTSSNNVHIDDGAHYMKYKCSQDSMYIDYTFGLKKSLLKMNPALSLNDLADNGFMSFPLQLNQGQLLPDVDFVIASGLDDGLNYSTSLTSRKVEGKEKITTPAGVFDCVKITGTRNNSTTKSGITKPTTAATTEYIWLAPKVGVVKQESYSKTGKLLSVQYLSLLKK